jgi:serine phosphatase RsbU (regulator of sigma subunit)/pSer/pThr/pTyr-binding forkhead associated (FHA) protein
MGGVDGGPGGDVHHRTADSGPAIEYTASEMMLDPLRLDVHDSLGVRTILVDKAPFMIGRREGNDLRLTGSEVSREHARIEQGPNGWVVVDLQSRYGTYVNEEAITDGRALISGDRVRLGRGGGAELVCRIGTETVSLSRSNTAARDDLRQITVLLDEFRSLGSGRVLQEVLALVLDAAIELSGAERAFIMLAGADDALEFKLARGRGKVPLTDATFAISQKIPDEVFRTGESRVVTDLLDSALADVHQGTVALGIRNIVCVPLNLVQYVEEADAESDDRRIGVLYLDSREKGHLLSEATQRALDTLASEASVAIESAQLYRAKVEKSKMEQEMRIAAEIQQALLPKPLATLKFVEAAAASIPCRSIGGDFFDYLDFDGKAFGFALGDVAGKGPPAALLSALIQGMFASQVNGLGGTATFATTANQVLCRRGIESRFVTLMVGVIAEDGTLTYTNAGHNPPFVIGPSGVRRLEEGGPVVGLLEFARYSQATVALTPGDTIIVFSDGVSEAMDAAGEEFGDDRLQAAVETAGQASAEHLVTKVFDAVSAFTSGTAQGDDITAMVLRYLGPSGTA